MTLRRVLVAFVVGLMLGPASWWIAGLASGRFEPFDDGTGFFVCQAMLALPLFALAFRRGLLATLPALPGAWLGMNLYAYALGSDETRAWIVLLFSSLTLLMFPLAAMVAGGIGHALRRRAARRRAADDGMRSSAPTPTGTRDGWAGRADTSND